MNGRYRTGKNEKAETLYEQAIERALKNQFNHDAALACELAAEYYARIGDPERAGSCALRAYHHYERWRASAKTVDIDKKNRIASCGSPGPDSTSAKMLQNS